MEELSIFIDESGEPGTESEFYGLTLVLHDQNRELRTMLNAYEGSLQDGGQELVSGAVRGAMQYTLSRQAVLYRSESPEQYRLAQAADFICTLELTARKYDVGKQTATDRRFFGSPRGFRRDYLRQVRRKQLTRE